jgi:hypothetical protein
MSSADVIGSVISLTRYPVKSMMGEELKASEVSEHGLVGDRAYALVDAETGKVASAKNPRKWGRLFNCRAVFATPPLAARALPPVRITFPDGSVITSNQPAAAQQLSALFGRQVSLAVTPPSGPALEEYWPDIEGLAHRETITSETIALGAPGTFFDYAPLHLLTTATLGRLEELYPQGRFQARRFRPNLVVEVKSGRKDFVERDWVGRTLALGDQVRLRIALPCPRCVMTTLPQGDLPNDPGILRTAAQHTGKFQVEGLGTLSALVGVYASVVSGGTLLCGDPVRLE